MSTVTAGNNNNNAETDTKSVVRVFRVEFNGNIIYFKHPHSATAHMRVFRSFGKSLSFTATHANYDRNTKEYTLTKTDESITMYEDTMEKSELAYRSWRVTLFKLTKEELLTMWDQVKDLSQRNEFKMALHEAVGFI